MADELLDRLVGPGFKEDAVAIRAVREDVRELVREFAAANEAAKRAEGYMAQANSIKQVAEASKMIVDAQGRISTSEKEYQDLWKRLLKERDEAVKKAAKEEIELNRLIKAEEVANAKAAAEAKKKSLAEQAAFNKQVKAEERELNKLIALEEREIAAKTKKEAKDVADAKKQADRDYQTTWRALLDERDQAERDAAIRRKKEAAEAVAKVAADSNVALSKTLNDLRSGYDRLTKAERENEHIGGVLVTRIQELDSQLKASDAAIGRFGRNVGNYSSATAGLRNSVQQIARELPSISNGFATFASAIGNNIAPAQDAITKFRQEQAKLRAEGKPTQSVFQALSGAVFNYQSLLLVGVTLLTVYGKEIGEFASKLFRTKGAMDKLYETEKLAYELRKAIADSYGKEITNLDLLRQKIENVNLPMSTRIAAVKDIQALMPRQFAHLTEEAILAGKVGDAYRKAADAILASTRVRVFGDRLGGVEGQITELLERIQARAASGGVELNRRPGFGGREGIFEMPAASLLYKTGAKDDKGKPVVRDLLRDIEEYNKLLLQRNDYLDKIQKNARAASEADKSPELPAEGSVAELRQRIEALKDLIDRQKVGSDEQIASTKQLVVLQKQLKEIEGSRTDADRAAAKEEKERVRLAKELKKLREDLGVTMAEFSIKLKTPDTSEGERFIKDLQQQIDMGERKIEITARLKVTRTQLEEDIQAVSDELNQRLIGIENSYQLGLYKSIEDYERAKLKAVQESADQQSELRIKSLRHLLQFLPQHAREYKDVQAQIDAAELEQFRRHNERKLTEERTYQDQRKALIKQLASARTEVELTAINSVSNVIQSRLASEAAGYTRNIEKITEKTQVEVEKIRESTATEEEKKARIKALEKRQTAEIEEEEGKRRKIIRASAIVERTAALLRLGVDTFQKVAAIKLQAAVLLSNPVTAALAPLALAQIPFAVGTGAIAAAAMLATKLPEYRHGVKNAPGGPAVTDEVGPELYTRPDGSMYLGSNSGANIKYIEPGTSITPHHLVMSELMRLAAPYTIGMPKVIPQQDGGSLDLSVLQSEMRGVRKAVEGKETTNITFTNLGLQHIITKGGSTQQYLGGLGD